jgi:Pleckstrin homology domain
MKSQDIKFLTYFIFRHCYFVLVQGHLMRFKLTSSSSQPASILHSHAKTINLLDAYVTSGYFAALELDEGNKLFEPKARRFQDGLETDDADMDTLIVIRYVHMKGLNHV